MDDELGLDKMVVFTDRLDLETIWFVISLLMMVAQKR